MEKCWWNGPPLPHASSQTCNRDAIFLVRSHSWWRHQIETFSALLAICARNSPVSGEFPAQRPVTLSFDVFFDLRLNNGWVNNGDAGDLRLYRAHSDVTVMWSHICSLSFGALTVPSLNPNSIRTSLCSIVNHAIVLIQNLSIINVACHE